MGRPENPVDFTVPARGKLAELLRAVRHEAGLTYDELAVRTGRSPATLKRACGGKKVPKEKVVVDIVQECVGTRRVAEAAGPGSRPAWPTVAGTAGTSATPGPTSTARTAGN
ncbi:helix-turn-helix domain-containing protein [Streptomyces hydrogenans]|uniref:helix-turn-helix domain-containing protein n=1 Tax=Streptomyces hydrogenans TaxID=1873719 RepID=UPI0035D57A7D